VLYVEAPLTPLHLRRGRAFVRELTTTFAPPQQVAARLWRRRHFLPLPYHAMSRLTSRPEVNRIGQRWLSAAIRRDLRKLQFRAPIVVAGLPHAVDAIAHLPKCCVVYHCADEYAHVRGFPSSLPSLEAELCRRADLVITTSETLCQDRRQFNANTHWVPNGADVAHFAKASPVASELRALKQPLIGFVGGLSQWVDVDLLAQLAAARPHWAFALVGPIGIDVGLIRAKPNVHLLGPRPYADLPAYLAGMDVALIPFRHEPVTYHADPIKAYEYLAAGVPVVATNLPALARLAHVVRLADTPADFERQIEAALAEGRDAGRAERQAEAQRHSWSSRFAEIEALIHAACRCES